MEAMINSEGKAALTPEAMKKVYDDAVKTCRAKRVRARHILVPSEDEAKAILADLKKGEILPPSLKKNRKTGLGRRGR